MHFIMAFCLYIPTMTTPLLETNIKSLQKLHQGKVRDIYAIDAHTMLLVSTDRLSAFDVILPTGIQHKGAMLTQMANFWFELLADVVPNHLTGIAPETVVASDEVEQVKGRAVVVKKLKPLPIEAIVRGYLVGSGWKEYQLKGTVCDIPLPAGLELAQQLPQPLFTPSSKAAVGEHDENISIAHVESLIGKEMTEKVQKAAIALYSKAAEFALTKGIIIADTKFEFGLDENGVLHVMDEVLTPDSSRFWPAEQYQIGSNPPSYDKQYVRDWLESSGWNKVAPGPRLPDEVALRTSDKYSEAFTKLTGRKLST